MSYLRAYYNRLATAQAPPTPSTPPPPKLEYLWNAATLPGTSASTVPNTGTAGKFDLVTTGGPVALSNDPGLGKLFNFTASGDYFQSSGNFPVQKTNGPRTLYLAFRLDSDLAGDICGMGQPSYYGANFNLSYDGENSPFGGLRKLLHLALAGMDMKPDVLTIGSFVTLALRADPVDPNTCRLTVLKDSEGPLVQDFRWLDTDSGPYRMGGGTWLGRAADMSLALNGVNLVADSDQVMSNNLRQMQLSLNLPARPLV